MRTTLPWLGVVGLVLTGGCAVIGPIQDSDAGPGQDGTAGGGDAASAVDAAGTSDACVPGWVELLDNGDFDQGPSVAWTSTGATMILDQASMPINVDSGTYAARLGSGNDVDATLAQAVHIPAAATQLRMTGRTCFVTNESSGTPDQVQIALRNQAGSVVVPLKSFSNQDATAICNWGDLQISTSSAHPAEDLSFALHVTTNASVYTTFYFDTLSLEANVACGG